MNIIKQVLTGHKMDCRSENGRNVLNEVAIRKLTAEQMLDFMEIIESRYGNKSTIFASQLPVANRYETLDSNVSAADAILDRVVNTASIFTLKGDSIRKNTNSAPSEL